jgi:hypothetical protein
MVPFLFLNMAEGQGFEPWVGYKPTPVFKTGALNHSATLPLRRKLYRGFSDRQYSMSKKMRIAKIFLHIYFYKNKSRAKCSAFVLPRITYKKLFVVFWRSWLRLFCKTRIICRAHNRTRIVLNTGWQASI